MEDLVKVRFEGRFLSWVAALLVPLAMGLEAKPGVTGSYWLKFYWWMLKNAIQGRRMFTITWDHYVELILPYKLKDRGLIIYKDGTVKNDQGQMVGGFRVFEDAEYIYGWF